MRGFVCLLPARSFLEGKGKATLLSSLAVAGPDPDWMPFAATISPPSDYGQPLRQ